jgi:hypothetical protein
MNYFEQILTDIEVHSAEGIRNCFENGVDPNGHFKDKPLIYELIGGYKRGKGFSECVQVFLDFGLVMDDPAFIAVLSNNELLLEQLLKDDPSIIQRKYTFNCAFTPITDASLLHVCAEFNHPECARLLVTSGSDVNEKAGVDEYGFGGQTPVFHTVNQHNNFSIDSLKFLVAQSADLRCTVSGLIWGKGYEWETFIPSVNPISYAMMGLLPQFQRNEPDIYEVVGIMMRAGYAIDYRPANVPNKYLVR